MATAVPSIESAAAGATAAVRQFLHGSPKLLIGGKWVAANSGKTFETINPTNEEVLGLVAEGDKADVDEAVRAARKAFETGEWPSMGPHQRARYLFTIADLIETHTDELAELVTLDNGKPIGEAIIEVGRTADTFRYYAGWATKFYGETNPSDPGIFNYTLREPIRVCGQIIPWNGPLATISWKIAPASAFGNTLVLKLAREEIFGPVAVLIPFKDENDAVFQSNDTTYGLAAAVWTRDISRAHKVARALKSGTVWVNCYGVIDAAMPFGGYKQSGFGREGSQHVLDLFTQIKSVYVKL